MFKYFINKMVITVISIVMLLFMIQVIKNYDDLKQPDYPGAKIATSEDVIIEYFFESNKYQIHVKSEFENVSNFLNLFEFLPYKASNKDIEDEWDYKLLLNNNQKSQLEIYVYKQCISINGTTYEFEERDSYLNAIVRRFIKLYYHDIWNEYKENNIN